MAFVSASKGPFLVKAYPGDFKTLLAFNFTTAPSNLAGFSIFCQPPTGTGYYLFNELQFQNPSQHAQIATERPNSTVNAPIQKYRWTHVPGSNHQGTSPASGSYVYTVTPRYFDAQGRMLPLDASLSLPVTAPVAPFKKGSTTLGFSRGYIQSEAFVHHFGPSALLQPTGKPLQFDTTAKAGVSPAGQAFTFADEFAWLGSTARERIFKVANDVLNDATLTLCVFAYDLNEPDIVTILLELAKEGRLRMILDNASLHVGGTPEDAFTTAFNKVATGDSTIIRGRFGRFAHDKVFVVSQNGTPTLVLTGSTNFSLTGLYVNANHVLLFDDSTVAGEYQKVFDLSFSQLKTAPTSAAGFANSALATGSFVTQSANVPRMTIHFSPHTAQDTGKILGDIANRIKSESNSAAGNVIFAVMQLTGSDTPVYEALNSEHEQPVYSFGISDAPEGTYLYLPGKPSGVLVTGKVGKVQLPAPFDQLPAPPGHEIHHKFVVCGLNGPDPVVYCGSSNLATGGEKSNGDNLLEIHDEDIATAFAIEALLLVDHYNFLDKYKSPSKQKSGTAKSKPSDVTKAASKQVASKRTASKKSVSKKTTKRRPASTSMKRIAKKGASSEKSAVRKT